MRAFVPSAVRLCLFCLLVRAPYSHQGRDSAGFARGQAAADKRLGPLIEPETDYFPFTPPPTREAWDQRAERLRRQLLVATGLWPMPSQPRRSTR